MDSEEIKEIVKLQQNSSGGLEVIEYDFKDSKHVSHFDKYPDKYQELCLDFLQDMLSKSKELANLAALWPFLSPFGYGEVVFMGAGRMDGWSDRRTDKFLDPS